MDDAVHIGEIRPVMDHFERITKAFTDLVREGSASTDKVKEPVWIRIPRASDREQHTGLTRTALYRLIKEGHVESKVLKQPGKKTGVRLIRLRSLLDYIESLEPDFCDRSAEIVGETHLTPDAE